MKTHPSSENKTQWTQFLSRSLGNAAIVIRRELFVFINPNDCFYGHATPLFRFCLDAGGCAETNECKTLKPIPSASPLSRKFNIIIVPKLLLGRA